MLLIDTTLKTIFKKTMFAPMEQMEFFYKTLINPLTLVQRTSEDLNQQIHRQVSIRVWNLIHYRQHFCEGLNMNNWISVVVAPLIGNDSTDIKISLFLAQQLFTFAIEILL